MNSPHARDSAGPLHRNPFTKGIPAGFSVRSIPAVLLVPLVLVLLLAACSLGKTDSTSAPAPDAVVIQNKGSDTIVNLALAWAEAYMKIRPDMRISVTGGGSGTGIAALINKTVDIANASRKIKSEELAEAEANGVEPVEFVIARDAIVGYYTGLRAGLGRGDALRQAKLALMRRANRGHPFYWASFIQSGEWANLDGAR